MIVSAFRSSALAFLFALLSLTIVLREPAQAAEIDPALVAAAKKEGRVVLYTPMIVDQIVRPLAAAFREKYGIEVQYQRLDSAAVVLKILNEYRARRSEADVFSTSLGIESLIASKAARKIESASAAELPAHYKDAEGYWAANRLYVLGPAMNTRLVKAEDFPKTFDDLLDPKYTGKIVWRRNNLTGATGFVGNVLVTMGEEKGMEYLRKLSRQRLITVSISDRAVLDQIIAGEYAMTIAMTNHNVEISRKQGAPVAWSPLETAMVFSEQMGLTTLSTRPNAGKLFLEYAISREGQTVFQKAGYIPTHPAVPPLEPKLLPAGGGFKGNVFTPDFVAKNRKRWDEIVETMFR
jgi:ABC-type Fe3+ transport system substrate-binding protein